MSRLLNFALIAVFALVVATPARAQHALDDIKKRGTLIVGVKADYKPYGFRDPGGAIIGMEPDLAADVAKRLGVKLELVPVVSSNRMQFLEQGKIDLMIATMNDNADRRKVVYIVEPPYYSSGVNILTPKAAKLKEWKDVKGKKTCMIQGAWYNKQIQQDYGAEIVAFKGTAEVYSALKGNDCVGFIYDDTLLMANLLEPEWKEYEMPFKTILDGPWGLAVKLGEESFYKFMSTTVADWHRTGMLVQLEKKYGLANSAYAVKMNADYKAKK
ncbi:MAG: transporter substrate-binding domain-containing protein [Burkholderiales bacterium]